MSDEEDDFDGEKTQFWLPGQEPPGLRVPKEGGAEPADAGTPAVDGQTVDFDLTADVTEDAAKANKTGAIDFDIGAEETADGASLDLDLSGDDAGEPVAAQPAAGESAAPKAAPVTPPPLDASPAAGSRLPIYALIAIVLVVIYFVTR